MSGRASLRDPRRRRRRRLAEVRAQGRWPPVRPHRDRPSHGGGGLGTRLTAGGPRRRPCARCTGGAAVPIHRGLHRRTPEYEDVVEPRTAAAGGSRRAAEPHLRLVARRRRAPSAGIPVPGRRRREPGDESSASRTPDLRSRPVGVARGGDRRHDRCRRCHGALDRLRHRAGGRGRRRAARRPGPHRRRAGSVACERVDLVDCALQGGSMPAPAGSPR